MRAAALSVVVPAVLITACAGPGTGNTVACIAGEGVTEAYGYADFEVEGTFVSIEDAEGFESDVMCESDAVSRVITIEDDEGVAWSVGFGVWDHEGQPVGDDLDTWAGEAVSLTFRHREPWGWANGFVLTDESGLLVAVEEGSFGEALEAGDTGNLRVSKGEVYGRSRVSCGTLNHRTILFEADADAVELAPYASDFLEVDGNSVQVIAAEASAYDRTHCTDVSGDFLWAASRQPRTL